MRHLWTAVLLGCFAACGGSSGEPSAEPVCDMAPVIFVHGLGQGRDLFDPVIAYLREHGVPATCLHAIDLKPGDGDNIQAAEKQIAPFVEEVLERVNGARVAAGRAPLQKVQILGHSMGALSARWYTAVVAPGRIATFISTSGANHGTDWECSNPWGPGHRQMCPAFARSASESTLQFRLNGARGADVDETPFGVGRDAASVQRVPPDGQRAILYVTLRTADDPYIVPAPSLELDGAGGAALSVDAARVRESSPGNFVLRARSGHDELLSSADTLQWLLQVVRHQQSRTP
jgi:pimeloyl-ACP methyl ester carboxylesterase